MSRMTKRRALDIVLRTSLGFCEGSGVGLRKVPSEAQKAEIVAAVRRLWREAHDYDLDRATLTNYGIYG